MIRSGVSGNIAQYCAGHWTLKTTISYHYKLRYWMQYNEVKNLDLYELTKEKTLQFLIHLFEVRQQHVRSIKAAFTVMRVLYRAAACSFSKEDAKQVGILLQGMFVKCLDPVLPRTQAVWDVSSVLDFFTKCLLNAKLSLRSLGTKLACLILLATMRHAIDLTRLDVKAIT